MIEVSEYFYALLLSDETEIVAYHRHERSRSDVTDRHLHLGPAATRLDNPIRPRELHKVHVPTDYVTLEQVIRLAITEFGVTPPRADRDAVLRPQGEMLWRAGAQPLRSHINLVTDGVRKSFDWYDRNVWSGRVLAERMRL